MYISGIKVQNSMNQYQLGSSSKNKQKQKTKEKNRKQSHTNQQRPYSSQYKLSSLHKNYGISIRTTQKKQHPRHQSHNKIFSKKNQQDKDKEFSSQNQQRQSKGMKKAPIQVKKTVTSKKKVSIQESIKFTPEQQLKINAYFRYHPITIISIIGFRDALMKKMSSQLDFVAMPTFKKPTNKKPIPELWIKLLKNAQLKGKYKYRQKFHYGYSAQLKALQYKVKASKKKKQSSSSSEDDEPREKCRDMTTWKKSMGVQGKIFIIKGKYPNLRNALLERGWTQNQDKKSTFYDLRWTTKISDINFDILKPNQMVNHFNNNAALTSKYGIIKSLRSVLYPESIDIDRFFPKAFDLSDLSDFQNFLEIYKWVFCQSLLKNFVNKPEQLELNTLKIKVAIIILQRRLTPMVTILSHSLNQKYALCTPPQWKLLLSSSNKQLQKSISKAQLNEIIKNIEKISTNSTEQLIVLAKDILQQISKGNGCVYDPQFDLNGAENIWIVKPAFLSRGRGIKCLRKLNQILDCCLGKQTQYVVQKYIENPLIINSRKFDIRIWVLVEDFCPPKIWFYNPFYVRFCLQAYNTDSLKNRYAHLTNNSVQKYNSKISKGQLSSQSMWDRKTFQQYISKHYSKKAFNKIVSQMKEIVIATILGVCDQISGKKGSFQLIGYDMMIDDNLNTWLIQINSSPAMDYSTEVTKKLVAMVMEDIVKVIVDTRKKGKTVQKGKTAGQFKCIYAGQGFKVKNYPLTLQNNQQYLISKQQKEQGDQKQILEQDEQQQEKIIKDDSQNYFGKNYQE